MAQTSSSGRRLDERFVPATLEVIHPCPARADFIEVCFATPLGPFQWCFPEPPPCPAPAGRPPALALALGPYGVQVHVLHDGGHLGDALPSASALPLIVAGAQVHIARRLITTAS